jgi:hypothetical protein
MCSVRNVSSDCVSCAVTKHTLARVKRISRQMKRNSNSVSSQRGGNFSFGLAQHAKFPSRKMKAAIEWSARSVVITFAGCASKQLISRIRIPITIRHKKLSMNNFCKCLHLWIQNQRLARPVLFTKRQILRKNKCSFSLYF